MILRPDHAQPDVLEVENWAMTGRVFGRQLEFEAMNIAVQQAHSRGIKALRASYIPTPKNEVVRELYASLGFFPADANPLANGSTRWSLDLAKYVVHPTHIARAEESK
jgi:predicted enzyme involved in methoxymalonyl-ACP biosynthesis